MSSSTEGINHDEARVAHYREADAWRWREDWREPTIPCPYCLLSSDGFEFFGFQFPREAHKLLLCCGLNGYSPNDTTDVIRNLFRFKLGSLRVATAMHYFDQWYQYCRKLPFNSSEISRMLRIMEERHKIPMPPVLLTNLINGDSRPRTWNDSIIVRPTTPTESEAPGLDLT